jgi:hypothetical protein
VAQSSIEGMPLLSVDLAVIDYGGTVITDQWVIERQANILKIL